MNHEPSCSKCNAEMLIGFLVDQHHMNPAVEYAEQSEWVAGAPDERSTWTGSIQLKGRDRRKVFTYCCSTCGYLESYALAEPGE